MAISKVNTWLILLISWMLFSSFTIATPRQKEYCQHTADALFSLKKGKTHMFKKPIKQPPPIAAQDRPADVNTFMKDNGARVVLGVQICKREAFKGVISVMKKFKRKTMSKIGGKVYHAYVVVTLGPVVPESLTHTIKVIIEKKISGVHMVEDNAYTKPEDHECVDVEGFDDGQILKSVMDRAEKSNICLYCYVVWKWNCQDFIWTFIKALFGTNDDTIVKQKIAYLISLKKFIMDEGRGASILKKIAVKGTDLINYMRGIGGISAHTEEQNDMLTFGDIYGQSHMGYQYNDYGNQYVAFVEVILVFVLICGICMCLGCVAGGISGFLLSQKVFTRKLRL
eukprot:163636_1